MTNFNNDLNEEEINEIIGFVDTDNDGLINYTDFAAAMTPK